MLRCSKVGHKNHQFDWLTGRNIWQDLMQLLMPIQRWKSGDSPWPRMYWWPMKLGFFWDIQWPWLTQIQVWMPNRALSTCKNLSENSDLSWIWNGRSYILKIQFSSCFIMKPFTLLSNLKVLCQSHPGFPNLFLSNLAYIFRHHPHNILGSAKWLKQLKREHVDTRTEQTCNIYFYLAEGKKFFSFK